MDLEETYTAIIKGVGEDLNRPGLSSTPKQAAKALQFLTQDYRQNIATVVNSGFHLNAMRWLSFRR